MGDSSGTGNQKVLSTLLRFEIKLDVQDTKRSLTSLRGRDEDGAIIIAADEVTAVDDEQDEEDFFFNSDPGMRWQGQQRRSLAAVDFYTLTDVVTANFNDCFDDAFSRSKGTAPFDRVVLDYDESSGRQLRFLRSLREVTAGFTGVAIFTKQDGLQVPNTNMVASVQLKCMEDVDITLLTDIQKADPSAGLGSNVIAVSARVINNEQPENNQTPQNAGNNNNNSDDGGLDAVVIVAMVIAILATILLAVALIIAWRRKKRAESAYMIGRKSSKVKALKTNLKPLGRRGNSSNPSDTPTTERSTGNHSGEEPPLPGEEQNGNESEMEISQMPSGLYPESVISDDINSSLQAYEKGGEKGQTPHPPSGGRARQHPATQGGRREVDNQSVSSMESYGYSLDGYASSLAPSTQYGY